MLKLNGAFAPASQRGNELYRTRVVPPERFVAAHLSGGLKILYKHLGNKKKARHQKHVSGSQTDEDGKFQPYYPVPLLAGRYKFVQVIGHGQSAVLIAAEDTFHPEKRAVAVKVMHLDYSNLGAQEAECVRQLNKADVLKVSRTVQLYNTFRFDSHHCLVFELLRPRPLHQYFQRCQFDNEESKLKVIRKIALQLLQVLGFLKRENVIHADLKPENILIEEGEEIKIKVIDFGNAIHCVHREVSLYYDEFELQTLIYRAPEVMFGVPFGHEIDMWSLGCILAELHIGKPLFLGRTKSEILLEVSTVLGPIPKHLFHYGKFFQDLSGFLGPTSESNQLNLVANMMKKLLNSRHYAFASFLVGLLHYNPSERLSPCQAAMHPFLASDFPFCYLLPQQGDKLTDPGSGYTDILLTPDQYVSKPDIQEEMKRQHFSGTELLRKGTRILRSDVKEVYEVAKQEKIPDVKGFSLSTTVNTRTSNTSAVSDHSTYTVESKSTPIYSKHGYHHQNEAKISAAYTEKERETVYQRTKNTAHGGANDNKMVDKKLSNVKHILPEETYINFSEGSDLSEERSQPLTSKESYSFTPVEWKEYSARSQFFSKYKPEFTSQDSWAVVCTEGAEFSNRGLSTTAPTKLEGDVQTPVKASNSVARTRVYYRKAVARKQEQHDLSPELKRSKLGDAECQEHSEAAPLLNKTVKSKRGRKKKHRDPLERDSERTGSPKEHQDDVVLLL